MNKTITTITIVLSGLLVLAGLAMGIPAYSRYQQILNAKNELAAQQYLKQVAIAAAESKNESAKYEAEAEVTRANGVAQANKIIGDSLKNNEAYLKYLFVNNLEHTQNQIIYIPTEANLPILEAKR
jgi:regulator of protease activity HflC (stomatin/prohibitin superfamily)